MPGPVDPHDDLIDAALGAAARPRDTASLRETVLLQTLGVRRFRRRLRRCFLALSLAGCYAAGLATATLPRTADRGTRPPPAISSGLPTPSAAANREMAAARLTREEVIRRDADRCLLERGDVKEAVRGYGLYLKLASADGQAISPEKDSWLLMALKDARSKEMKHDGTKRD
jgi:hypothetical protein